MTTLTRRRNAPATTLGPYGRWVTDPVSGKRSAGLTDEGRAMLAEWLSRYKRPVRLLAAVYPACVRLARRLGADDEDLHSACLHGAVDGLARYRPEVASIAWWMPYHLRARIQRQYIRPLLRQVGRAKGEAGLDRSLSRLSPLHTLAAPPELGTNLSDWHEVRRRVYRLVRRRVSGWQVAVLHRRWLGRGHGRQANGEQGGGECRAKHPNAP